LKNKSTLLSKHQLMWFRYCRWSSSHSKKQNYVTLFRSNNL